MPSLGALADAFRDGAPAAAQLRVSLATRDAAAIVRSVCDKRNFAKSVRGRRSVLFHFFYITNYSPFGGAPPAPPGVEASEGAAPITPGQ